MLRKLTLKRKNLNLKDTLESEDSEVLQPKKKLSRIQIPANNTLEALRRCLNEFPLLLISRAVRSFSEENPTLERVGGCPLLMQSVLYAECADRLEVDRDLASLQNARIARRLKVSSGQDDWAVVLTQDLKEYLHQKRRQSRHSDVRLRDKDDDDNKNNGDDKDDHDTNAAVSFYAYVANALYSSTTLSFEEAENLYTQWCKSGSPLVELQCDVWGESQVVTSGSSSSLAERVLRHYSAAKVPPLSKILQWLLHTGLFIKRSDVRSRTAISQSVSQHPLPSSSSLSSSSSSISSSTSSSLMAKAQAVSASAYLFGAPECGRLVAYLREGRAELNRRLRKHASREILLESIEKSTFRKSALPTRLHVLDAIGSGMAVVVETASGKFIRAAAQ